MSARSPLHEEQSSAVRAGQLIAGKYVLIEPLGAGGMGEVWKAQNVSIGAEVAMKLMAPRSNTPAGITRFRREAHATAQLAHRSIVRVFDLVELPDAASLAMVMERLRGKTLGERLRCEGALSIGATIRCLVPILSALHYAHERGIIHRDLKPENVFLHVEPDGEVVPKLLDFGISKNLRYCAPPITIVGGVVGTPMYMSPEQMRGDEIDARSDVFCAGVLVYTCLTGRSPFVYDESAGSSRRILELRRSRPKQIPPSLWAIVARALERDPDDRYPTAAALATALRSTATSPPSTVAGARQRRSRRIAAVALAACIAGLACGAAGGPVAPGLDVPNAAITSSKEQTGSPPPRSGGEPSSFAAPRAESSAPHSEPKE
jgi:serine/threonine-protein kinase